MALSRSRLLRGAAAQLRCSIGAVDAPSALPAVRGVDPPAMLLGAPLPAAPGAPQAPAACWQPSRSISAASILMAERQAGGGGQPPAPPPPPAAGGGEVEAGSGSEEELSDDEAADAMAEAFERLIQAAFEMVQQGKPMEAEYVLAEGARLGAACAWAVLLPCCLRAHAPGWRPALHMHRAV